MSKKTEHKLEERLSLILERTATILNVPKAETLKFFEPHKPSIRLNTLKYSKKEFEHDFSILFKNKSLAEISWAQNSYTMETEKADITQTRQFKEGKIYMQNASSLIPTLVLEPKPHEFVLDMCAAPGGKLIHLAELTKNEANITANDTDHLRVGKMRKLCVTYGANIAKFYSQPAQFLTKHLQKEYFDKILLDAPCSGEGMLNLDNKLSLQYWSLKKINRLSKLQKRLIAEAYNLLKNGGTLVYSTCTLAPEENEEVIDYALNTFSDLELQTIQIKLEPGTYTPAKTSWKNKTLREELKRAIRIVPDKHMEAFFIAKLKKN